MGKYSLSLAEIQREVDKVNNARTLPVLHKVEEPATSTTNPQGVKNSLGGTGLNLPSLVDMNKAKWEPNTSTLPLSNPTQGIKALIPSTPADKLDTWLSDGYKLSKEEEKEAKAYIKEYRKNNRYPIGQPDATKEEIDAFKKVVNLESKLSAGTAFWSGLVDSLPFVDAIQDKMVSNNTTASKVLDENRVALQAASEQSPVMAATGRLTGEMAKYSAGSQIAKAIPALNKATNAIGSAAEKITKSKGLGEAAKNIIGDTALDVALDTIPSAVENAQSGMSAGEVAKEVGKNIGTNLAFNAGGEVLSNIGSKILPKLQSSVSSSIGNTANKVDNTTKLPKLEKVADADVKLFTNEQKQKDIAVDLDKVENYQRADVVKKLKEKAKNFLIEAMDKKGQTGRDRNQTKIAKVPNEIAEYFKMASNGKVDVSGKDYAIEASKMQHELISHGDAIKEASRGQIAISVEDAGLMVDTMLDPDIIEHVSNKLKTEEREVFVLAKRDKGYLLLVEAVGGKNNPNIVPVEMLHVESSKLDDCINSGKSISDLLYKDSKRIGDVEGNNLDIKNRVTVARHASDNALAQTSETSQPSPLINSIPVLKNNVNTPPKTMAESIGLAEESISVPVGKDGTIGNISRARTNTLENSGLNTADELANKYLNESNFKYESVSEKESMDIATSRVAENIDDWKNKLMDQTEYTGADVDTMMMIYSDTVNRARATGDEALWKEAGAIFKKIQEAGTKSGQAIQAFAKWSRNTPEGIVADTFRNVKEKATSTLGEKKAQKLVDDLTAELQKDIYELAETATREGVDSKAGQQAYAEIGKIVDKNTPKSITGIVKSYLMDSMLLNFRTLISRNAGGNLGYNSMEFLRQPVTAGIDAVTSKFTGQRTRTGWNTDKIASAFSGLAKGITDEVSDIRKGIHTAKSGQNTITDAIYTNAHPFKGNNFFTNALNKIDDITKHGLSIGDRPFYEAAYKQRLSELNDLRQRGLLSEEAMKLSDEDFNVMAELSAKIDGLTATYQDDGAMAKALTSLKNAVGDMSKASVGADILSQFVMPFTKTPGNIITRSLEYSPYGLAKNAVNTVNEVRKGNFNQQRFVDEAGRNILGTALFGAGVAAYDNGLINGGYSDDKDMANAQKQAGMQEYALNTGKGNFDISWIPVLGNDLVAAAAFKEAYDADSDNPLKAGIQGGLSGANTLLNTSTLQGMNRMFGGNTSYSSEQNLLGNAKDSLTSGFGQAIPSLLRQVTQSADPYQRNISNGDREYWQNNLMASLPVLRQELQPKVDNEGNIMMQNQGRDLGSRIIENMISPGQYTEIQDSVVNNEAMRLFESTGNNYAFLPTANRKDIKNGDVVATDEQFFKYQVSLGKKNSETAQAVIESVYYAGLSDEEKEKALQDVYSAMKTVAKEEFVDGYASDDKIAAAYKENGTQGVIDYMQKKHELESRGLKESEKTNAIYSESGIEGLDQYAEYKSILDGAEVSTSGAYEEIFNDKGSEGLNEAIGIVKKAGGSERNDLLPVLQKTDITDAEKGEYLQYFGGDLPKGASYAKAYWGDAGVYQYYLYKKEANADGVGNAPSSKEVEAYLRDLQMANNMRAQWYDILASTKKNPFK